MTKTEAISIFGSGAELARALGITRGAVSQWPEILPQRDVDRVTGAALRLKKPLKGEVPSPNAEIV